MAKDSSAFVGQALVAILKRAPTVQALVDDRTYPPQRPPNVVWPFVGVGVPVVQPFVASGMDGSALTLAVHCYAETTGTGADTIAGFDMASAIARVVVAILGGEEGAEVQLQGDDTDCPYPATAYINWTGTQVVQSGSDAGAWHAFATFDISVNS